MALVPIMAKMGILAVMKTATLHTPLGLLKIEGNSKGIASVSFIEEGLNTQNMIPDELKNICNQLIAYFEGSLTAFDAPLAPEGTNFQKRVWVELMKIPFGKTVSYQEIANKLGDPKVIRAAASANGRNPIAIIIPCHRVIGADGSLTGYAGGLHRKKWLLEHESPVRQGTLF